MATLTYTDIRDLFPAGTSVSAYKRSNWTSGQLPPTGSPQGSSDATGTVSSAGALTLTGLTADTDYFLFGNSRYVNASTRSGSTVVTSTGQFALRSRQPFNVLDEPYGAKGDESANDTAAIQAAINDASTFAALSSNHWGEVVLPPGTYMASGLTISQDRVRVVGQGGRVVNRANSDVFTVNANEVEFHNAMIDGNGATFSGNGITCQTSFRFKFVGGRIENIQAGSYTIRFTVAASTQRLIANCIQTIRGNPSQGAIGFIGAGSGGTVEEINGDTTITGVNCLGGDLADLAGCATVEITACNMRNIFFDAHSKKVILVGNRIATGGADTTVLGGQHTIVGNIHAGRIILGTGTTGTVVKSNVIAIAADAIDNSGVAGSNHVNDYQIALARVSHNANQTLTTGVAAVLAFNTDGSTQQISDQVLVWHSTVTANSRLLCGRSGYYEFHAAVRWAFNATGHRQLTIYKNGLAVGNIQLGSTDIAPNTTTLRQQVESGPIYMTAAAITGDTVNASATVSNATGTPTLGQAISGAGIPAGAYISNIVGSTLTISANATATATGVSLQVNDYAEVVGLQDSGGNLTVDSVNTGTPSLPLSPVFTGKFLGYA